MSKGLMEKDAAVSKGYAGGPQLCYSQRRELEERLWL